MTKDVTGFVRANPRRHADVEAALRALDADELRTSLGDTLERLDAEVRGPIEEEAPPTAGASASRPKNDPGRSAVA